MLATLHPKECEEPKLIDVHSHLLPGIDDGSENMEISLSLAQDAVRDGITHALMTPHHMNGRFTNHPADVIRLTDEFQHELDQQGIPLTVFPSQEVRINGDLLTAWDNQDLMTTDEGGHYMLLEFPHDAVPTFTDDMVFQLEQRGVTPVFVHPERNEDLMAHPEKLFELIKKGAYAQITASSYVGTFGKKVERFAEDIIDHGLGHMLASDAHHIKNRDYEMSAAFKKLIGAYGNDVGKMFDDNAKAIVNGDPVHRVAETPIKKKRFFPAY